MVNIHEEVMCTDPVEAWIYRCYDRAGTLVYIGMTCDPVFPRVPDQHRKSAWWPLVDHNRTTVTAYSAHAQAQNALILAIRTEGLARSTEPARRPCALYRHYDAAGTLLYIGITHQQSVRDTGHRSTSAWVAFAHRTEARWFPTRAAAGVAEKATIRAEVPVFNRDHAPDGREARVCAYLEAAGRMDLAPQLLL